MAYPRRKIRDDELATIKQMGSHGCRESDIAKALHMSLRTWRSLKEHCPRTGEAFHEARKLEEDTVVGKLYQLCMDGNVKACVYILNTRHGYRGFAQIPHEATPLGMMTAKPLNNETQAAYAKLTAHEQALEYRKMLTSDTPDGQ